MSDGSLDYQLILGELDSLDINKNIGNDIEIKEFITDYIKSEIINIQKEKNSKKNITKAFMNVGGFGEELTTVIYPNSVGSASKGGCSFDNNEYNEKGEIVNAREVKTCCLIQPKKCNICSLNASASDKKVVKVPFFQEVCYHCGKSDFCDIKDSRFGIDTKAHFQYKKYLSEYILVVINFDRQTNYINIIVFKVNSNNQYFEKYLQNQFDNSEKSKSCNLLPFSYDFYSSGPIELINLTYDINGNIVSEIINLSNNKEIDFSTKVLTQTEKNNYNIPKELEYIPYSEIKLKLVLRNKSLNKNRGVVTRI